jgi:hypothetical protein
MTTLPQACRCDARCELRGIRTESAVAQRSARGSIPTCSTRVCRRRARILRPRAGPVPGRRRVPDSRRVRRAPGRSSAGVRWRRAPARAACDRLALDREARSIHAELKRSGYRMAYWSAARCCVRRSLLPNVDVQPRRARGDDHADEHHNEPHLSAPSYDKTRSQRRRDPGGSTSHLRVRSQRSPASTRP